MDTTVPTIIDRPTPCYPVARPTPPASDPRFTFGLAFDVAKVLEQWGYPKLAAGSDFVELQQLLFLFIYGPAAAEEPEAIGSPAVTAALSTMDMLARVPAVQARLAREGITSLDEPAPYLPAAAPTGDEANRETAAVLRERGHVRFGDVRAVRIDGMPCEVVELDDPGRGDAEMDRLVRPGVAR